MHMQSWRAAPFTDAKFTPGILPASGPWNGASVTEGLCSQRPGSQECFGVGKQNLQGKETI